MRTIEQVKDDGTVVTKYAAHFYCNKSGRNIRCGIYNTEKKAAQARDRWAVRLYGRDVDPQALNFPGGWWHYRKVVHAERVRNEQTAKQMRKQIKALNRKPNPPATTVKYFETEYIGVRLKVRSGLYVADLDSKHIDSYDTAEEAARAYDIAAIEKHGDAAVLNFDRSEYGL